MHGPTLGLGRGAAWLRAALACAAVAVAAPTPALERIDLYTVRVEVPRGGAPRAEIERLAMEKLLVRVTGSTNAPYAPELAPLLGAPSSYVNSFGYPAANLADVVFNSTRIERELTRLGMRIWGSERPLTLAWIVVENELGERLFVGADTPEGVTPEMAQFLESVRAELDLVEEERGVPIELPLLDLEDLGAVPMADVFGGFEESAVAASQRYGADAVLLGRIQLGRAQTQGFGMVRLLLVMNGTRQALDGITLRDGLDAVANELASRLAAEVGADTAVKLTVLDVENGNDFGRVLSFVRGLSDVRAVNVVSATGDTLVLQIAARGGAPQLARLLALDRSLVEESRGTVTGPSASGNWPAANDGLVFRLRR
jgi:hypothetical protein